VTKLQTLAADIKGGPAVVSDAAFTTDRRANLLYYVIGQESRHRTSRAWRFA